jgi:hypothetical protein
MAKKKTQTTIDDEQPDHDEPLETVDVTGELRSQVVQLKQALERFESLSETLAGIAEQFPKAMLPRLGVDLLTSMNRHPEQNIKRGSALPLFVQTNPDTVRALVALADAVRMQQIAQQLDAA